MRRLCVSDVACFGAIIDLRRRNVGPALGVASRISRGECPDDEERCKGQPENQGNSGDVPRSHLETPKRQITLPQPAIVLARSLWSSCISGTSGGSASHAPTRFARQDQRYARQDQRYAALRV
jgi:hypothetical protein